MAFAIGHVDLSSAVVGSAVQVSLTPNLDDSFGSYFPDRGTSTQEDFRLNPEVIRAVEEQVRLGFIAQNTVFMTVDEVVTPKWDNQLEVIFLNAASGRISTHQFTSFLNPITKIRTLTVEPLP